MQQDDVARYRAPRDATNSARGNDVCIDMTLRNDDTYSHDDVDSIGHCSLAPTTLEPMPSAPIKRLRHATDRNACASFAIGLAYLVCSLVLFVPTAALLLVLLPVCWLVRRCANCCCCLRHQKCSTCVSRVSTMDAFWLHDSQFNKSVIQCLFDLEGGLDTGRIRDLVNARLVCAETKHKRKAYPRFTQKIVPLPSGFAWQIDDDFCIGKHICAMPQSLRTRVELAQYISQLAGRSLAMDKPLWEIHILSNFGETKDTMLLLRIHPCVGDGMSLLKVFYRLADDSSAVYTKQHFGRAALVFNIVRASVMAPFILFSKLVFTKHNKNILHGAKLSGRKIVSWSEPFEFARAYRIKQVSRGKLNDILMAAISGSLRVYMQAKGILHPYDCRTTLLVDLRPYKEDLAMGNKVTLTDVMLPTNTEGAIPTLWATKHRMEELKNSTDLVALYGAHFVLSTILPFSVYQRVFNYLLNKSCAFITNLPGPDVPLKFGSREIKGMVYWMPPRDEVVLSLCVSSYGDQIRLSVLADSAVVPDPDIITTEFITQMNRLSDLLAHRRIPGEHPHRTRLSIPTSEHVYPAHEPSLEELQDKMLVIQQQLQELKTQLDAQQHSREHDVLLAKVELLKDEFKDLLAELRRQKAADGATLPSDDEEEEELEARHVGRKRSHSSSSRKSMASVVSTPRPVTIATNTIATNPSAVQPKPAGNTSVSCTVVSKAYSDDSVHSSVSVSTAHPSSVIVEHVAMRDSTSILVQEVNDHVFSPAVERKPSSR